MLASCFEGRLAGVVTDLNGVSAMERGGASGPILTFATHLGAAFANVRIRGPLVDLIDAGGALDLTFA